MSFCSLISQNNGIAVLQMHSNDGRQHLTSEAITELVVRLEEVRWKTDLKGLVTTSRGGSFCDGVDHDHHSPEQAARLAERLAEVVRRLLQLPVPTVATMRGDATSLGLALALAHDHCIVWEDAVLRLPEAQRGRRLPKYVAALLRDKLAYSRARKLLMLKSQPCSGKDLAGKWYSAQVATGKKHLMMGDAYDLLEKLQGREGTAYAMARQKLYAQTCAAVGLKDPPPPPRPRPPSPSREDASEVEKKKNGEGSVGSHKRAPLKRVANPYKLG